MTRPKVPDDKRQRTAQACDSCKRRKQKVGTLFFLFWLFSPSPLPTPLTFSPVRIWESTVSTTNPKKPNLVPSQGPVSGWLGSSRTPILADVSLLRCQTLVFPFIYLPLPPWGYTTTMLLDAQGEMLASAKQACPVGGAVLAHLLRSTKQQGETGVPI
ncbi:hypothetical protein F5144DRAFT_285475 [Chaetomium tenue]|uniref:Uncharacterized protein n=1 Tax=Chaetomium tenue TaxID=1854479 RepID=A0ACB7P3P2_9PEZI|nr:hypothetical protein F5144DRAFT_285475 [Chaetomium globosum]